MLVLDEDGLLHVNGVLTFLVVDPKFMHLIGVEMDRFPGGRSTLLNRARLGLTGLLGVVNKLPRHLNVLTSTNVVDEFWIVYRGLDDDNAGRFITNLPTGVEGHRDGFIGGRFSPFDPLFDADNDLVEVA